jgi:hypothetical protein
VRLPLGIAVPTLGGGSLESFDSTGHRASPIPGEVLAVTRAERLDVRCILLAFRLSTSVDPLPNGGPVAPLPLAEARRSIERAMASWNDIPTSYVEMRIGPPAADLRADHIGLLQRHRERSAENAVRITVCELPHEPKPLATAWEAPCGHRGPRDASLVRRQESNLPMRDK